MLGAMAEEKMMLMLAVLCIILSALINQYVEKGLTVRKLGILVGLLLGFVVVINLVDRLAPDMLNILFNKKNFMDYATATFDEGYRIPRVGSFQVINNLFLRTPIKEWLVIVTHLHFHFYRVTFTELMETIIIAGLQINGRIWNAELAVLDCTCFSLLH